MRRRAALFLAGAFSAVLRRLPATATACRPDIADPFECLRTFIVDELRCSPVKVQLTRRLREDLGVDGEDMVEFFQHFFQAFEVDSVDFEYERYGWYEEELFGLGYRRLIPITVADLLLAVELKRWPRPEHMTNATASG